MNPFDTLLTPALKQLYNNAIDALLNPSNGLVQNCILRYLSSPSQQGLCNNCIYDSISKLSSNMYNGTGPKPFSDGGICPVCIGAGLIDGVASSATSEVVRIAVIVDSKKFINIANTVNIDSGIIQTISNKDLIAKLHNAFELEVHNITYQRISEPQHCGLSDHKYITILWKSKL